MKKVLAFALGTIMMVSLVACGKIPGTSDLENSLNQLLGEVSSLVEESGDLSSILGDLTGENNGGVTGPADLGSVAGADNFAGYKLNLPKDNFSVTYKVFSYGLTFGAFDKKTGNVFITGDGDVGYSDKYDFNEGKVTGAEFGSDEWGWRDDDIANYSYNDFVATKLASFDDIFMYVFYAYGKENSQLKDYCVGVEEVAGHYCWVFDAQGLNAMTEKYWVDIESGLCMKMLDSYGDGFEVVELNTAYYGE